MAERRDFLRKPSWLKTKIAGSGGDYSDVKQIIESNELNTICKSGLCPNMSECWSAGTATFLILGDICTRSCRFCATKTGKPLPPDANEPARVSNSVSLMNLKHCVLTSVDRDDLPDYGAAHWASTIRQIRRYNLSTTIEALVPDFNGEKTFLQIVIDEAPEVMSHNLETVERLTPLVRNRAQYQISLEVLSYIAGSNCRAKSGIMVGLGETEAEIYQTMEDILNTGCKIITIGQYLQPTKYNLPVEKYYSPEEFQKFSVKASEMGFINVESAPLVRSSYHAEKHVK